MDLAQHAQSPRTARLPRRASGFTFIEVLFAVFILAIGFIMIAGMLPVAIEQAATNGSETIASAAAREAVSYIGTLPGLSNANVMLPDGQVHRFDDTKFTAPSAMTATGSDSLWDMVKNNLILPEDPRYAWAPFYVRGQDASGTPDPYARLIIVIVKARNHDAYGANDLTIAQPGQSNSQAQATLMGRPVSVHLNAYTDAATSDSFTLLGSATGGTVDAGSATEAGDDAVAAGGFLIIQNDPSGSSTGSATGWVLRIGEPLSASSTTWLLQPGGDMKASNYKPQVGQTLSAFIIGQGSDPETPTTFAGGAQDVMVYTSYVQLH